MNKIYEINNETIALIPINDEITKVYEKDNTLLINKPIMNIIEHSCKYFGSSYKGRHEGTKNLIGVSHKSPIIIEESRNIIYFPTTSPRLNNCSWIALNHVKDYKKKDNNTIIYFENGEEIELEISIGSFDNQYLRATKLESVLRKRKLVVD